MDDPSLDDFARSVGESFQVETDEGPLTLTLKRALPLPGPTIRPNGSSFALHWLGPAEPLLPQGTYSLSGEGKAFELFIVPIVQDESGTTYEAVFN
ncbi:MAG: DUF6916 family protein [Allosphingosinicella sp.]